MFARLRPLLPVLVLLGPLPAAAMVGGAPQVTAPHVLTIVGSRGNTCTGALIAPDIVLTAAHCATPGASYKVMDGPGTTRLIDIRRVALHPGFDPRAYDAHRATADVALLQLAEPLRGRAVATVGVPAAPVNAGRRFTVTGTGVTSPGDDRGLGIVRQATLAATGQPGSLQIRLADVTAAPGRPGLGACSGDSGAPVSEDRSGRAVVVGVVGWSTGPGLAAGCGGLTGVTPLTLYRDWVVQTARGWGSELPPEPR
jgi:secreted trypsin-like serine protease